MFAVRSMSIHNIADMKICVRMSPYVQKIYVGGLAFCKRTFESKNTINYL